MESTLGGMNGNVIFFNKISANDDVISEKVIYHFVFFFSM